MSKEAERMKRERERVIISSSLTTFGLFYIFLFFFQSAFFGILVQFNRIINCHLSIWFKSWKQFHFFCWLTVCLGLTKMSMNHFRKENIEKIIKTHAIKSYLSHGIVKWLNCINDSIAECDYGGVRK